MVISAVVRKTIRRVPKITRTNTGPSSARVGRYTRLKPTLSKKTVQTPADIKKAEAVKIEHKIRHRHDAQILLRAKRRFGHVKRGRPKKSKIDVNPELERLNWRTNVVPIAVGTSAGTTASAAGLIGTGYTLPSAHAQVVGTQDTTPTSSNPLGGIIAIGQDFYTGAANVGADYAGMVDPRTYQEKLIKSATYDKHGYEVTAAVYEDAPESKSHVWKVQDAAMEQVMTFAFDRPEFERLSKEGNLPFDTALSKASKVAPAQLVGGLVAEAGIWIGTAGLGRAVWGVSRGVKLSQVAAKAIGKAKGTVPNVIKLSGKKGNIQWDAAPSVNRISFPTTRRGGAKRGLKEAAASMRIDPFQIMGSAQGGGIPKFVPLIGGKGSTFTKHSLPKGPGKMTSKMRAEAQTKLMHDTRKKTAPKKTTTKKTTTKKTAPKKTAPKKKWRPNYKEQKKLITQRWASKGTAWSSFREMKKKGNKKKKLSKSSYAKNIARKYPMSTAFGVGATGVGGYAALAGHSP